MLTARFLRESYHIQSSSQSTLSEVSDDEKTTDLSSVKVTEKISGVDKREIYTIIVNKFIKRNIQ